MITVTRMSDGREVSRNSSHFKKFLSSDTSSDETLLNEREQEDKDGRQQNDSQLGSEERGNEESRDNESLRLMENQNTDGDTGGEHDTRRYPTRIWRKPARLNDFVCD